MLKAQESRMGSDETVLRGYLGLAPVIPVLTINEPRISIELAQCHANISSSRSLQ
jgi:hypothetical protein